LLTGLEWWLTFSGGGCWVESLDFRVEISGDAARGYEVVLRAPDGVEVSATKQLPVPAVELDALAARIPDAVIASSATVRYSPSREERPVQQLGGLLFDLVLAEQGRGMLAASRHQADREGRQLRIVLQVRPPELARLPWEFMFDSGEDDYICLSTVLVRYPQVPAPVRRLQVNGPLRVLGMAARPGDQQALATAAERQRLHEALGGLQRAGRIELDWVPGQTWRDLRNAMRHGSWNVLHFIGHGGFDAAAQEGTLALADDGGDGTYRLGSHQADMRAAMARVPDGATVTTTLDLLAPLAARTDTFWIGNSANPDTEYIVFDGTDSGYSPGPANIPAFVASQHRGRHYQVIYDTGDIYVFRLTRGQ